MAAVFSKPNGHRIQWSPDRVGRHRQGLEASAPHDDGGPSFLRRSRRHPGSIRNDCTRNNNSRKLAGRALWAPPCIPISPLSPEALRARESHTSTSGVSIPR